jgi:hypothetical protein
MTKTNDLQYLLQCIWEVEQAVAYQRLHKGRGPEQKLALIGEIDQRLEIFEFCINLKEERREGKYESGYRERTSEVRK